MTGKILYIASTWGHLKSFHQPYLLALHQKGWKIHIAGRGCSQLLPGVEQGWELPFEKRMSSLQNWRAAWEVHRLLEREHYDLVSVHTSLAAFFARVGVWLTEPGHRPLVWNTVHGYLFDSGRTGLKGALLAGAEKVTAPVTQLLWTMNGEDTRLAQEMGLCSGPIHQIPGMGVDLSQFHPASPELRRRARAALGLAPEDFVLVYAAEFSKRKNQSWLIEGLAQLNPRVKLLLAGQGDQMDHCQARVQQLGLTERVRFCGFVSPIQTCYHAGDLCVSASRSEGLPFHIMEAMACGLPVVATRVKGHEDLVEDGVQGFLFPLDDRQEWARLIQHLMEHPELCLQFGSQGAKSAEAYALERVLPENLEAIQRMLQDMGLPQRTQEATAGV